MVTLSASRISTALKCSLLYYFKYIQRLPDPSNSGALRGSATHEILECLLRKDRKPIVDFIIQNNDSFSHPAVKRMCEIWARKLGIYNDEDLALINKFILTALKNDFYHEGCHTLKAEEQFHIGGENWKATGFLDVTAVYDHYVKITDYKSSKKKFSKQELEFNLQNYFYTYATQLKYPGKPIEFEFKFLKFDKDPVQKAPQISPEEMEGFLEWCGHMSEYLDGFDKVKAVSNTAKSNIENRWLCGTATYPGELKVNSQEPKWYCSAKFPFTYFSLEENGKVITSDKDISVLEKIKKDGQEIKKRHHAGCGAWRHLWEK